MIFEYLLLFIPLSSPTMLLVEEAECMGQNVHEVSIVNQEKTHQV